MRVGVVVLPGSNCDHDAQFILRRLKGAEGSAVSLAKSVIIANLTADPSLRSG